MTLAPRPAPPGAVAFHEHVGHEHLDRLSDETVGVVFFVAAGFVIAGLVGGGFDYIRGRSGSLVAAGQVIQRWECLSQPSRAASGSPQHT
jgi:hypothetical protein